MPDKTHGETRLKTFWVSGSIIVKTRSGPGLHEIIRTSREHSMPIKAPDATQAAQLFRDHTGIGPDWINQNVVDGFCEGCAAPIFDGQDHFTDAEGIKLCRTCCPDHGEGDEMGGANVD